jgi:hypothetical protein
VLHLQAAVDLGYRVSTGPTEALRPWGLVLLRRLVCRWGDATDPDVPDAALMEQYSAQILSSLRAALSPGCAPNACAAGALLAAEFVACGLSACDPGVHKRVLALLTSVTTAWGPPGDVDDEEQQYSQWSAMCTKAALLTAHARMAAARSVLEWHEHQYAFAGYASRAEYFSKEDPVHVLRDVRVPILYLNAKDVRIEIARILAA